MDIIKDSYTALILEKSSKVIDRKRLRASTPQEEISLTCPIAPKNQQGARLKASISWVCIGEALILGCYFA
jgi:hypothetical protein